MYPYTLFCCVSLPYWKILSVYIVLLCQFALLKDYISIYCFQQCGNNCCEDVSASSQITYLLHQEIVSFNDLLCSWDTAVNKIEGILNYFLNLHFFKLVKSSFLNLFRSLFLWNWKIDLKIDLVRFAPLLFWFSYLYELPYVRAVCHVLWILSSFCSISLFIEFWGLELLPLKTS